MMRHIFSLGLIITLAACQSNGDKLASAGDILGNPTDGMLGFIGDTVSFKTNPNRPMPESDTILRAMGQPVEADPLLPEAGNIWPALPRQEPTLLDLQKPPPTVSSQQGSSTPPQPMALIPPPVVREPARVAAPVAPQPQIAPAATTLATPGGTAVLNVGANGVTTYTLPGGSTGRAIDNGNGTMTLIGNDGQVTSVPAPR